MNNMVLPRKKKLDDIRHLATDQQIVSWKRCVEQYQQGLKNDPDLVLYQNYPKSGKPRDPWSDR